MATTSDTLKHAFFYNSENKDRVYDADSFEHLLKKFFLTGVFFNDCQVTAAGEDMNIQMSGGYSNIGGKVRFFAENQSFTVETAHATYDRIDTVVIERNDIERDITAKLVTGGYSSEPVAKDPVRENGVYQLVVAKVYVKAGAVKVTQANITDTRADTDLCGYVSSTVKNLDFSQVQAQFDTYLAEYKETLKDIYGEYEQDINTYLEQATGLVNRWIENMKGQLDGEAETRLQNQIDAIKYIYVKDEMIYMPQTYASYLKDDEMLSIGTTEKESV